MRLGRRFGAVPAAGPSVLALLLVLVLAQSAAARAIVEEEFSGIARALISTPAQFQGPPEVRWVLETDTGVFTLDFAAPPAQDITGHAVRVRGYRFDAAIEVLDLEVVSTRPLGHIGDPELTSDRDGTQNTLAFIMKFSDKPDEQQPKSFFESFIFGAFPSLKTLWEDSSYDAMTLGGSVNGWWDLPRTQQEYLDMGFTNSMLLALVGDTLQVAADQGMTDIPNGSRLLFYFNDQFGCSCALGTVGFWTISTPWGDRTVSIAWMPGGGTLGEWAWSVDVTGHEFGHNLGWWHSGNVYFNYDSKFDVLSRGCKPHGSHTIVFNKVDAGWLAGGNAPALARGTMSLFTMTPVTRASGTRALTLDMGDGLRAYSVEIRIQEDHDGCILMEGALLHRWHKELLDWARKPVDATPGDGTLDNALWLPGSRFADPTYGLTIDILARNLDDSFEVLVFWPEPSVGCSPAPFVPLLTFVPSKGDADPPAFIRVAVPQPFPAAMPVPSPCN